MKTLKLRGVGKIKTIADYINISFEIKENNKNYEKCADQLTERTKYLYEEIIKAGFQKSDLKTTYFNIETIYDKEKTKGYKAVTRFQLEFDYRKDLLMNLVQILEKGKSNCEIKMKFEVKDKEAFKDRLLESAVLDSKRKAEIIAKSSGVNLAEIVNIDYNLIGDISHPEKSMVLRGVSQFSRVRQDFEDESGYQLEPVEIEGTDSVNVLWEIK